MTDRISDNQLDIMIEYGEESYKIWSREPIVPGNEQTFAIQAENILLNLRAFRELQELSLIHI